MLARNLLVNRFVEDPRPDPESYAW